MGYGVDFQRSVMVTLSLDMSNFSVSTSYICRYLS